MIESLISTAIKTVEKVKDLSETSIKNIKETSPIQSNMDIIDNSYLESLKAQNEIIAEKIRQIGINREAGANINEMKIKEISPYKDKVNEFIRNPDEVIKVYKPEHLQESIENGRIILKDNSIKPNLKDAMGRTNLQRMEKGLAPIDDSGGPYNLHHIGQKMNSPLAELRDSIHKEYDKVLHDKNMDTEIHNGENGKIWDKQRAEHWEIRAKEIENKLSIINK